MMSSSGANPKSEGHTVIVLQNYDRSPFTSHEQSVLRAAVHSGKPARGLNGSDYGNRDLLRFQKPIYDVIALRTTDSSTCQRLRRILYLQMIQRETSFWEWSKDEWIEIIGRTKQEYQQAFGTPGDGRLSLQDMAYLLGEITDLREVGQRKDALQTARLYFGVDIVKEETNRVFSLFAGQQGQGYVPDRGFLKQLGQTLGVLFLLNRSPLLADISLELLHAASQEPDALPPFQIAAVQSSLQQLRLFDPPPPQELSDSLRWRKGETADIAPEWVKWCQAWLQRLPKVRRLDRWKYNFLLTVGRWLADHHPEVVSPSQWSEDVALEYVSYTCSQATIGDYTSIQASRVLITKKIVGKKLTPRSMQHRLAALISFFLDVRDKPHRVGNEEPRKVALSLNPAEVFRLPPAIKKLIQPDPRDIDEVLWCKLTYAAATLTEDDYPKACHYPLNYHKAAALLWIASARRPNELARLRVGCIRRDWDPAMLDEDGLPLPGQEAQICYLHIPTGKTKGPYWVPIPKYAADAVDHWEQERPRNQPKQVDPKDNTLVDFLFCVRGKRMGERYINDTLIPALCRRAGVETSDARGTITGHRARSTIATILRKNGVSLDDLSLFLGHSNPTMVRAYARTDPFRFGRDMNRANDLMRIVEGIIDTKAAKAGQPNVFFFLGRGSDGQPRFCGNPAWDKCRHRLACLKCSMYVGASQASKLAERLEARDELFKFQTQIEMNPQEKAAVEGDIETLTSLIQAEASVPLPELPNEQFRFNPSASKGTPTSLDETQTDLAALARELATLTQELTEAGKRTDGRNAKVRSLKKRITRVTEQMVALDQIASLTKASLGT
jgi:integrase